MGDRPAPPDGPHDPGHGVGGGPPHLPGRVRQCRAEAIQDCTTPGGECYERSQRQSALLVGQIVKAQQVAVATGSAPARENLSLTKANAQNIQVVLGILDREYPEAAAAVRAELGVKP